MRIIIAKRLAGKSRDGKEIALVQVDCDVGKNLEQRQTKWRNFCWAGGGRMFVVCDNRICMCNIRSEINYCLGHRPQVVPLTDLADLQTGKRGEGDSIWLEVRNR